jgi:Uma2 family endonuclease
MSLLSPPESPPVDQLTVDEIASRVGAVPLWRIRMADPAPGLATEEDVERIRCHEDRLYELIDGVLVEKAVSDKSSMLAAELIGILREFIKPRRLGWLLAPDGYFRLFGRLMRAPDVSFSRRDQRAGGKPLDHGYSRTAPALAVEVFSPGNTVRELEQKRAEFFKAGTEMFWIVYPEQEQIVVATPDCQPQALKGDDVLDGGSVLPGFTLRVGDLFAAINLDADAGGDAASHD